MGSIESEYQIKPWRKDVSGLIESIEQSGYDYSILGMGILPMDEERISKILMENLGISSCPAKVKGGLIPCLGEDSFLHFLARLIEWDREADLDYFGIDYGGGEMTELHYEVKHLDGKKMVKLRAQEWIKSDSFASLRLLPPEYDLSSLENGILIICPAIADADFKEKTENQQKVEMRYLLITPSLEDSVRVINVRKENVPSILFSGDTSCYIYDFIELANQNLGKDTPVVKSPHD